MIIYQNVFLDDTKIDLRICVQKNDIHHTDLNPVSIIPIFE